MNEETVTTVTTETQNESGDLAADMEALADATIGTDTAGSESGSRQETDATTEATAEAAADATAESTAEATAESTAVEPQPDLSAENELFERGIRAGIPIKELLEVPTHAMAERMVALAEKANGISKPNEDGSDGAAGTPDDDWAAALAEMEKDGDYNPNILRVLKGLQKENAALKSAGLSAERQGFFEKQFGSLDGALRDRVDAVRLSQLKSKFDVLEAGYRANGSKIAREDVFREAARLALGDLMNNVSEERKAKALEQRRNLKLARPGGESGRHGGEDADDPFAEFVAAMG